VPITPFHFGPGLLVKAAAPRRVSFSAFAMANVAVDCEPVWHWFHDGRAFHGPVHSVVVAAPLGLIAGTLTGLVLGRLFPRTASAHPMLRSEVMLASAALGGLLGGGSHPLLDGLMHRDVHPFWPFFAGDPLLGLIPQLWVYLLCVLAGVVAAAMLWRTAERERRGRAVRSS
jgi:hypothetical protein